MAACRRATRLALRTGGTGHLITLQSLMLVTMGGLLASLLAIIVTPAYRRRVERLTMDRIRKSMPVTEAEIRADKDRMRAQYAIRVHKLEAQNEQQRLLAARQLIETNRRDATIADLEAVAERFKSDFEETANARRVLEHTVTHRLPRLEQQLDDARRLITARDEEMAALKGETTRSPCVRSTRPCRSTPSSAARSSA